MEADEDLMLPAVLLLLSPGEGGLSVDEKGEEEGQTMVLAEGFFCCFFLFLQVFFSV